MIWFSKMAAFWVATVVLMGFTLEIFGYTLYMCQQDCKDEPDDPVCSRWNFTAEDQARTKVSRYRWLRNECKRKCFSKGTYERVADMELCTKNGETRMTYICSEYDHSKTFERCMRNESLDDA